MAIRLSTGLRQAILGTNPVSTEMDECVLNLYSGTQPSSADSAPGGTSTLLVSITVDGGATGLTFDAPVAGVLSKAAAETWEGTAVATGTVGWFRMYESGGDPSVLSTTESRIDGTVATSGGDVNISSTAITSGANQTVTDFDITMPAS